MDIASQMEEKKPRKYCIIDRSTQAKIIDESKSKKLTQRKLAKKYRIELPSLEIFTGRLSDFSTADYQRVVAPDAREPGTLTEPRQFNLMFETYVGAVRDEVGLGGGSDQAHRTRIVVARTTPDLCQTRTSKPVSPRMM